MDVGKLRVTAIRADGSPYTVELWGRGVSHEVRPSLRCPPLRRVKLTRDELHSTDKNVVVEVDGPYKEIRSEDFLALHDLAPNWSIVPT